MKSSVNNDPQHPELNTLCDDSSDSVSSDEFSNRDKRGNLMDLSIEMTI